MSIYDRYGGGLSGGSALPSDGFTPEQLANRDAIMNAPLSTELVSLSYPVVDEFTGEIYYEQRNQAPVSLQDYQGSKASAFDLAFTEDSLLGAIPNYFRKEMMFGDSAFAPDPNFNINDHQYVYDLVSPEYYNELNKAESYDELVARTQYFGKISKDTAYLDQLGAEGVGYRVAAFLTDFPAYIALGWAGTGIKATEAARIGGFARAVESTYLGRAAVAGVVEGGFEGIKLAADPTSRDEVDILLAMGLGGALGGLYKPAVYTDDVQQALMQPIKDLANDVAATGKIGTPPATASRLDRLQLNVATVLRTSRSETLRNFGENAFLDVTRRMATDVKAAEVQTAVIDGIQSAFNKRFNPLYKEYLEATGRTSWGSRYRLTSQDDFYELVGKIANQPNRNWDDMLPDELLSKIRKANDEMGTEAYDILARNKHDMFTSGEIARGRYLPRRWNRAKLINDINTGVISKIDAEKMFAAGIKNALREANKTVSEEKALEAGKQFVATLRKPQVRVGQAGFIMEDNAFKSALEDIQKYLDLNENDMAILEKGLQDRRVSQGAAEGTASSTRRRGLIDIETQYLDANGNTHTLSDYLENNVQSLWQSYARQMGGDTALRKLGISSRAELSALRSKVEKELMDAAGQLDSAAKRDLANLDAVIGDFLNISGKFDPEGSLWKGTRIVNNLVRSSKLGSTWFAMTAELAQVVHTNGIVNTFKAVPVIPQLFKSLKGPKAGELIEEIQSFYNLADEILQMPSAARYDDVLRGAGAKRNALTVTEDVTDRLAEAAYMLGGTKSGTSALEALFAAGANNKLVKIAGRQRLKASDRWYLEQLGFQGEDVTRLLDAVRTSGSPDNKYVLGLANWQDQDLAMKLAYGIRRVSNIAVQRGNIGDQLGRFTLGGTLAKDNVMGSMALNLRNYMVTAWNKQFSRKVGQFARAGEDPYGAYKAFSDIIMQGLIVGGLGYAAKTGLDYATGAIDEDKFDERMSPLAFASNTFNMTTFASFLPVGIDYAYSQATGQKLTGQAARGNELNLLGASEGYLNQALNVPSVIGKAVDPNRDITAYDVKRTLGLLPLSSLLGVKQAIGVLAESVGND